MMKMRVVTWRVRAAVAAASVLLWGSAARAQDVLEVAPETYKKIAESSKVRVFEVTFKPGAKIATHSHPEHLLYLLTDGTLVMRRPGRTAYEMNVTAGQALILPAQTGSTENVGDKPVRALVVELKAATSPARPQRTRRSQRRR